MRMIDLTGRRFGRLVVLQRGEDYITPRNKHLIQWTCRCDCGSVKLINGRSLIRGLSHSCGCLQRELAIENYTGQFTVSARSKTATHYWNKAKHRAQKKGIPFTLSKSEVEGLIFMPCHYCHAEPSSKVPRTNMLPHTGIDRKDSNKGYTRGNVVPCCGPCNSRKKTTPYREFITKLGSLFHAR